MISKYKGVSWDRKTEKWESQITINRVNHPCGFYDNELDAVKARDRRIIALGADYKKLQILKPLNR